MLITSSTIIDHADLVYKEQSDGSYSLTKDRMGNTGPTMETAMDSEYRVCIVDQRNLVVTVNKALYEHLRSEGFDVCHGIEVK